MILKTSPFSIEGKNINDFDNPFKKCPTLNDLMTKKNTASKKAETVHRRRDLDSLG